MTVKVRDTEFTLCPERCLFWPRHLLLAVADLHLGKAETFQQHGLWLPTIANHDDLERLRAATANTGAHHVVFLGDLIHSRRGVSAEVRDQFARWLNEFDGDVTILIGNHDRHLLKVWPPEWSKAKLTDHLLLDGFRFQHEPPANPRGDDAAFCWVGHLHPVAMLKHGPDRLRLPCFAISKSIGILPAFSSLAGGHEVKGYQIHFA